jgi:hypothetical protein
MSRFVDLSVTVDRNTFSPPSTNMRLEVTPHRRGPGFWQVSSVNQSLHTGAHIDSPLHVFRDGITTAEITLDQVMGEALVVDLSWVGANHEITIEDLKKGGAGDVKRGDIVLLHTGWTDKMYGTWPDYFTRSPYFPPAVAQWLVDRGPKERRLRFLRGVLRPSARLHLRGLRDASGHPGRGRGHHGGSHQPRRLAATAGRVRRPVLQDRRHRGRSRPLLRHGLAPPPLPSGERAG